MTDAEEEAFVESVLPKIRKLTAHRLRIMDAASQSMGRARGGWGRCVKCAKLRDITGRGATPVCTNPLWGDGNVFVPPADFGCAQYEARGPNR